MWNWLLGRSSPEREVILYTRQGCHLCEEALDLLHSAQKRFRFTLREVDVDTDPALVEQYGLQVPVVAVDGRVYFRGRVNAVLLRRLLRGKSAEEA
jgi:glutaredoxin